MPPEILDFEEPIAALLREVDALMLLPATEARTRELERLTCRIESTRAEVYASLSPWQRVQVARHPSRPGVEDFIKRQFSDFVEIHGDRRFADDHAMVAGFALFHDRPIFVLGHAKPATMAWS